jgi:hypothetical protein
MAGHSGPPIPVGKRAYFQERLRIRIFNFLLGKFLQAQKQGLNKNILAKRIDRSPEVINRWLGAPSNLTLDSISDLLLGIAAEELEPASSSPLSQVANNYAHFDDLASIETAKPVDQKKEEPASALSSSRQTTSNNDLSSMRRAEPFAYSQPEPDRRSAA